MLLIDLRSILSLIVCAHITESKVYILRDYDDELIYIDTEDRSLHLEPHSSKHKPLVSSSYKRKRSRIPKQAVVHYGRHIYHLDNFEDLTKLRSKLKPDYISYDYFDFNDLYRSSDPGRTIPWDYLEDIVVLSPRPKRKKCKGKKCEGNLRKYNPLKSKYRHLKDNIVKNKKLNTRQNPFKRFKIVGNSKKPKSKAARKPSTKNVYSSEEKSYYKKRKPNYDDHKKKYSSKSSEESKEWSSSNTNDSEEKYKKNKKKKKYASHSDSSEESTEYALQKIKKKFPYDSGSDSYESKLKYFDSNSIEESWQKKKKKKKKIYGSSEEKKRKTFDSGDEMVLQGNNMYDTKGLSDDTEDDRRRRLPQFLPKRYHWDPANINELGYYWFNGPKGKFPSPTPVGRRKN